MMEAKKNGQQNQHRECEGNLECDPAKRKCTPSHFCQRTFIRETGFTECSYVDIAVLGFSSNQSSTYLWSVITCAVEKSTCIPCSNGKWCFGIFIFFMIRPQSETVWRTRLSVQTENEQAVFRRPFLRSSPNVVSSASLNSAAQTSSQDRGPRLLDREPTTVLSKLTKTAGAN